MPMTACSSAAQAGIPRRRSRRAARLVPRTAGPGPRARPTLTSPVTIGAIAASQAIASAASPSSQAPPSLPVSDAEARCAAHRGPDLRGPLLLERRAALQPEQVGQRDVRPGLDRLPGPLRQQVGRRPAGASPSASASWYRCSCVRVVLRPRRGRQCVQHLADHRRALRGQVPVENARALEGCLQPHRRDRRTSAAGSSSGRSDRARWYISANSADRSASPSPARRGLHQQLIGLVAELLRQLGGPLANGPPQDSDSSPAASAAMTAGCVCGPVRPRGVAGGGAAGDPGLVHQPGPRRCSPRPRSSPCPR